MTSHTSDFTETGAELWLSTTAPMLAWYASRSNICGVVFVSHTAGGAETADTERRSLVFSYTSWTLNWSTMVTTLVLGQITAPRKLRSGPV